jgi:hypothetical protein
LRYVRSLLAVAIAALAVAPAGVAGEKAGRAILPPSTAGTRALSEALTYPHTLVALRRGRGGAKLLENAGGVLLSRDLALWKVESSAAVTLVRVLRSRHALHYFEPDRRLGIRSAHLSQGDPLVSAQWWLDRVGADDAEPPGPGVPVTVVDSGVQRSHPEFRGRPATTYLNRQLLRGDPEDQAHGTAVASVVGAPSNGVGMVGVYPRARLRSFDDGAFRCSDSVRGIVAGANARRGVINASWAWPPNECFSLYAAVQRAFGRGSIVVASAGNEFQLGSPESWPASLPHVLTVAATDRDDEPAFFSSVSLAVDLAAPGEGVLLAVPTSFDPAGYERWDGTSFSSPIVAGATAWVWTRRPRLDRTQIFNLIRWSARDVPPREGWDPDTGFGVLDIPAALAASAPPADPLEPNDDIAQVKANGMFARAKPALTRAGKGTERRRALLDWTEDPVDVYRAWIPAHRALRITLAPIGDVHLDVYAASARTVYGNRGLIASSLRAGNRTELLVVRNGRDTGRFVYVVAYVPERPETLDATYTLAVRTIR